jgi:hypothetical protein
VVDGEEENDEHGNEKIGPFLDVTVTSAEGGAFTFREVAFPVNMLSLGTTEIKKGDCITISYVKRAHRIVRCKAFARLSLRDLDVIVVSGVRGKHAIKMVDGTEGQFVFIASNGSSESSTYSQLDEPGKLENKLNIFVPQPSLRIDPASGIRSTGYANEKQGILSVTKQLHESKWEVVVKTSSHHGLCKDDKVVVSNLQREFNVLTTDDQHEKYFTVEIDDDEKHGLVPGKTTFAPKPKFWETTLEDTRNYVTGRDGTKSPEFKRLTAVGFDTWLRIIFKAEVLPVTKSRHFFKTYVLKPRLIQESKEGYLKECFDKNGLEWEMYENIRKDARIQLRGVCGKVTKRGFNTASWKKDGNVQSSELNKDDWAKVTYPRHERVKNAMTALYESTPSTPNDVFTVGALLEQVIDGVDAESNITLQE